MTSDKSRQLSLPNIKKTSNFAQMVIKVQVASILVPKLFEIIVLVFRSLQSIADWTYS